MKVTVVLSLLSAILLLTYCTNPENKKIIVPEKSRTPREEMHYHFEKGKAWYKLHHTDSVAAKIVSEINRTDVDHLSQMDSILVPENSTAALPAFFPFPLNVAAIREIDKIIFFSYPTQSFAAYEKGGLVFTGATNMGRKKDPTPTGLFFANWKAEKTNSTFNDEWELRWNFNIDNKLGVGWHQYAMPGYPASHSCLRLQEADAHYLYNWAAQWEVDKKDSVLAQGTPVVIFGMYNFAGSKPWFELAKNSHALDISEKEIEQVLSPHLQKILAEQQRRTKL